MITVKNKILKFMVKNSLQSMILNKYLSLFIYLLESMIALQI